MHSRKIDLWETSVDIHINALEHGFYEHGTDEYAKYALIICELSEAIEELRAGHPDVWHKCTLFGGSSICEANEICKSPKLFDCISKDGKPEGTAVELIDALIRLLDLAGRFKIRVTVEAGDTEREERKHFNIFQRVLRIERKVLDLAIGWDCAMNFQIKNATFNDIAQEIWTLVEDMGHDPMELMAEKTAYNRTRPRLHGKKF